MFEVFRKRRENRRIADAQAGFVTPGEGYLKALLRRVEPTLPGWSLDDGGLVGPGTLAIRVAEHESAPGVSHLDIMVLLNRERTDVPILRDCAPGVGDSEAERAEWAADRWEDSTWPVVLELLLQTGEHAHHVEASESDGLPGWHVIEGPYSGWGLDDHPNRLAHWLADNPVLPLLAPAVQSTLHGRMLSSVRLFLGGDGADDVAEVQINGEVHEAASEALAGIDWPRPEGLAYVKNYVLALHEGDD